MEKAPPIDLFAPVTSDVILEVRSGKMKPMPGLTVLSGIDKTICSGPVQVTSMGIVDDEHDYIFHGGVDKAIHGYCSSHYPAWQKEYPAAADRFRPGAFGENLVLAHMNERNVHIGDVYSVGSSEDGLLLQVSLPRQPCFKLNHRFGLRNFAPTTWKTSRTGWYYRVLRPGTMQTGDVMLLKKRPHPAWPIVRVQEYLHRRPHGTARVRELAAIDEFGAECAQAFRKRLAKEEAKARRRTQTRLPWRPYRVVEKKQETPRIVSFVLEEETAKTDTDTDSKNETENKLSPGSHVKLRLPNGLDRTYSVVSGDRRRFVLAVALADDSRGGSLYLHQHVAVDDKLQVGPFSQGVPFNNTASHHVFVAGGVGVTAFLAQLRDMLAMHFSAQLHYAVRSDEEVLFRTELEALRREHGDEAVTIYSRPQHRLDIAALVQNLPWNSRISFCGPTRMLAQGRRCVEEAGLAETDVHFEAFRAEEIPGEAFSVVVVKKDDDRTETLDIPPDESLLEVLQQRYGVDAVPSSCEVGNCGTCVVTVRQGQVEHRGMALTSDDKACGRMLACVSRGVGQIVVEI